MSKTLDSWSFSKLTEFEKCKYRTFLLHVERKPEPERPLPPGKTEHANDRGTRIHKDAELFVRGEGEFTSELNAFKPEFIVLRDMYKKGQISLEGEWGMDHGWNPTDWKGAWLRLKLDCLALLNKKQAVAIDFKTGKKYGNEVKHMEQLQLYALVTALRYPELEEITTELWYLDIDEITQVTLSRAQALQLLDGFDRRGTRVTTCMKWPANPSVFTCRWCMYGPWGSGDCQEGVR